MDDAKKDCCKGKSDCGDLMRERMHYFTGRHLTARDFTDEQTYHRSHRLFHNRILHGWGVVCGLNVSEHAKPECRDRYVEVSPGMALDCCGQDLVVECCASCADQKLPEIPWKDYKESHPILLLCLSYAESKIDPVPVLHDEGDCGKAKTDCGRFEEGWKLCWHWIAKSELGEYQWGTDDVEDPAATKTSHSHGAQPGQTAQPTQAAAALQQAVVASPTGQVAQTVPAVATPIETPVLTRHPQLAHGEPCSLDDCGDPCSEDYRSCVRPHCPPGHCVPIALICAKPGQPIRNKDIHLHGRPHLPYASKRLTHIVRINWPHGDVVSPKWFKKHDGRLIVQFDRKLQPQVPSKLPGPVGVSEATFIVQFGGRSEDLDFVRFSKPPSLIDEGCGAEYHVASDYGTYDHLENHTVWITLKCDFLYDCHGVRVDGNRDGIAGGTFESWFSVVSDEKYDDLQKEKEGKP